MASVETSSHVPDELAAILAQLGRMAGDIRALGVVRLAIFGSVARGETHDSSDLDVLVQFAAGRKSYRSFLALVDLLEQLTKRRVDLVTTEGLSRFIGPSILREAIDVPLAA